MMDHSNKKYGLILSQKKAPLLNKKAVSGSLKPRLSVFNNDDSSEDDGQKEVNSEIHKEAMKKIIKKQTKLEIQKALEEDATVYEYDSIYDDMKIKANKKNIPKRVELADQQKKPKYMDNLIKAAQQRNRERERVEERKIERERIKEGDQFSDKAQFVTSAYRKRMQERQEEEEEERRRAAIEDAMNVKKQKDLSGFYKHLLRQQVGEESIPGERLTSVKPEESESKKPGADDDDTDISFSSSESEEECPTPPKRKSSSSSESEIKHKSRKEFHESSNRERERSSKRTRSRSASPEPKQRRRSEDKHSRDRTSRREYEGRSSERDRHRSNTDRHNERKTFKRDSEKNDRHRDDRSHRTVRDDSRQQSSPERKVPKVKQEISKKDSSSTGEQSSASDKFTKRTNAETILSARERYLARKKAAKNVRAAVEDSD